MYFNKKIRLKFKSRNKINILQINCVKLEEKMEILDPSTKVRNSKIKM